MPKFVKLPSHKHVPKRRYGYNRLQSSVPGPSVGGAGDSAGGMGGGLSMGAGGLVKKMLSGLYKKIESPSVSGMIVRDEIPNTSSISGAFNDYETLPGVREVPMNYFSMKNAEGIRPYPEAPKPYSAQRSDRINELARQIEQSGEINPLIIAHGKQGPYILEGSHRFDALKLLGKESFPALVVKENFADGGAVMRNIPQNRFLGALSQAARSVDKFTKPARDIPVAGWMVPSFESLGNVLEEASYGMPLTTGKGMTTGIKPAVGMAALEASQLPPVARAGAAGAKALGRAAKEQLPAMAAKLAEKYPLATAGASPMYAVKPQGGQWIPGSAKKFAEDVTGYGPIGAVSPHEEWAEKAIPKYIEKYMGAEGDPLADVRIPYGQDMARWEDIADTLVHQNPRGEIASPLSNSLISTEARRDMLANNPWLEKLPPDTPLFEMEPSAASWPAAPLKDYINHVLEHAQTIPPEKLKQYDFPRLVKEVQKVDAERARKMASVEGRMEGTVPHKEYPTGYKWVEVQSPEALKREGDVMGHCVGGYCEDVKAGNKKIYSLRDPKGESHATVEVLPETKNKQVQDLQAEFGDMWEDYADPRLLAEVEASAPRIAQIKGKQNLAPKAEYQPYVQDLIRSGNWGDVRDIQNTGLNDVENWKGLPNRYKALKEQYGRYVTDKELDKYLESTPEQGSAPKMKKGGSIPCKGGGHCGCLKCLKRNFAAGGNVAPYLRNVSLNPEAEGALPAVSQVESGHNPKAIGPMTKYGRAMGQYQLLPTTAKDLDVDPMNPVQAQGGAHLYLSWLIGQTGSLKDALAAYNMGLGNFKKRKGALPKETENYVKKIMALLAKHETGVSPTVASAPVNSLDTTPQPDPATAEEDAASTTPIPDQIPSGPIGGGKTPAMTPYGKISGPSQGSVGARSPMESIQKILQNPLNLAMGE